MQWIRRGVYPVREALVDSEGELVIDVIGETLPLEDELNDARTH